MYSKRFQGLALSCLLVSVALPAVASNGTLSEAQWLNNLRKTEHQYGLNDQRTGEFLFAVGKYYHEHKEYGKEQPMYEKAMKIFEKSPGKNGDLLRFYSDQLARSYADEGKYDKAETLFNRSLAIGEKIPGRDKTYVLPNTLQGLANVYIEEGRYADAETALKKRIEMRQRFMNFGQVDPALVDLARLYTKWGKFDQAQQTFDELFKITPMPADVKQAYSAFALKASTKSAAAQTN